MDIKKKTKIKVKIGIILIVVVILLLIISPCQKVGIIYFTNDKCIISIQTDRILENVRKDFGDRVIIREVKVNMYTDDPPDSEEIKELRAKYRVFGTPVIIINGKEFTEEFTRNNIEKEICNEFITKPSVCS